MSSAPVAAWTCPRCSPPHLCHGEKCGLCGAKQPKPAKPEKQKETKR